MALPQQQADYKPSSNFDLLPAGNYLAIVSDASIQATKDGQSTMLKLTLEVSAGEYAGRKLFWQAIVQSTDSEKERKGWNMLNDMRYYLRKVGETDEQNLIGCSLVVKVSIKAAEGQWEASNRVNPKDFAENYKATAQVTKPASPQASPATPPPPPVPGT